jgi:hypothetical protein
MNYKIQPTGKLQPTPSLTMPGTVSGYVHPTYEVIEHGTQQIVKSGMTKEEAKTACRHLNFGGGFDGWTPQFFLEKIEIKKQID